MYSNDYDDGALMNDYIKWSKRGQTISTEGEEVKAEEQQCWKCSGGTADIGSNMASFPHIQDLCPADRRRIAELVKELIKCTKEMRAAKSELLVSESEKETMRNQYEKSLHCRETDKKQLEFQLKQARNENTELKDRITRILETLTRQIAAQEKQFLELTETVKDLDREKCRLRSALVEKQAKADVFEGEFRRIKELLESEKLERRKTTVHQACQTEDLEMISRIDQEEFGRNRESTSFASQNPRIKSKNDLDEPSTEGTLLRDLFFRKLRVEENETLDIIPVLSEVNLQSRCSNPILFD